MIPGFVMVDRIRGQEEYNKLAEAAHKDSHGVLAPTHVIRKDDKILGYFSLNLTGVSTCYCWFSTVGLTPREIFTAISNAESLVSSNGGTGVCCPVPTDSPFYKEMRPMGYKSAGVYELFVKEL